MSQPSTAPTPRQPHGWTLIELLIALSVSAWLLAAALPSFSDFLLRRRIDGLSAQLVSDLQFLRSSAVARHTGLRLRFDADRSGSCYLIHTGTADACSCSAGSARTICQSGAEVVRVVYLTAASGLQVQSNVPSMLVDPRLGTFSPAGSIELGSTSATGTRLRHIVNVLGRVRLCAPAGDWTAVPAC